MITMQRAFIFLLLFSAITAVIAAPSELDRKQRKHYAASKRFIRTTHGLPDHFDPIEHLDHLQPAHPRLEEDAWQLAQVAGNGPIHWTMDGSEKNFFATTRIASDSRLGARWNLNWRERPRDAYAFWHLKGGRWEALVASRYVADG